MNFRTGTIAFLAAIVILLGVAAALRGRKASVIADAGPAPTAPRSRETGATPVLIELFTSEGCSSCPPADALLRQLGRVQPVHGVDIIVLEHHVDYWDRLGWKDPFSSAASTDRQQNYARAFKSQQVYTPQMVVDGRAEFVGSSEHEALEAIRSLGNTAKPAVHLAWDGDNRLTLQVERLTNVAHGDSPQVVLAIAENMLHSDVKRGENAGRGLEHDGVVRQWTTIGKVDDSAVGFMSTVDVHIQPEWKRANLNAVVIVQGQISRRVLAVASFAFPAA